MLELHDMPGTHQCVTMIEAHAAGDATTGHNIFYAPFTCTVNAVRIIMGADVTGTATDYFNLNLLNRGTAGTGTTELANRDYASGTDDSEGVARALYSTATNLAATTVLQIERELVSSGLASPAITVVVEYEGR